MGCPVDIKFTCATKICKEDFFNNKKHTSICCLSVPEDSASDKAIKNSTFKVHCSSIQGEPGALINFHSAGLGEAIGLPISNVLQLYLF